MFNFFFTLVFFMGLGGRGRWLVLVLFLGFLEIITSMDGLQKSDDTYSGICGVLKTGCSVAKISSVLPHKRVLSISFFLENEYVH